MAKRDQRQTGSAQRQPVARLDKDRSWKEVSLHSHPAWLQRKVIPDWFKTWLQVFLTFNDTRVRIEIQSPLDYMWLLSIISPFRTSLFRSHITDKLITNLLYTPFVTQRILHWKHARLLPGTIPWHDKIVAENRDKDTHKGVYHRYVKVWKLRQ